MEITKCKFKRLELCLFLCPFAYFIWKTFNLLPYVPKETRETEIQSPLAFITETAHSVNGMNQPTQPSHSFWFWFTRKHDQIFSDLTWWSSCLLCLLFVSEQTLYLGAKKHFYPIRLEDCHPSTNFLNRLSSSGSWGGGLGADPSLYITGAKRTC